MSEGLRGGKRREALIFLSDGCRPAQDYGHTHGV